MFGVKAPFRLAVGALLLDGQPRTPAQVAEALHPEYADSRLISLANVEAQLQALKAVGVVRVVSERLNDRGELEQTYVISDYGRDKVRKNL